MLSVLDIVKSSSKPYIVVHSHTALIAVLLSLLYNMSYDKPVCMSEGLYTQRTITTATIPGVN